MALEPMPIAVKEWLLQNRDVTPAMVSAGWRQLKRDHLQRLGPGPGVSEAFIAMLDTMISERSHG